MMTTINTEKELVEQFKRKFGANLKDIKIEEHTAGVKKNKYLEAWLRIDRNILKEAVKYLCTVSSYPHISIISGNDIGDNIELLYHFIIYYGSPPVKRLSLHLCTLIPKADLHIESICDIIPGALITERENQDMLGVKIDNIPDSRRIFLPDDFPDGIYPWRKDDTGIPENMIKNLYIEAKKQK